MPSISPRISVILLWKCSGAYVSPNGNQLKQNIPTGMIKVVSLAVSGSSSIIQPEPWISIEFWEVLCSSDLCQCLFHQRKNVSLTALWFNWVRSTNPSILFQDHNHSRTPICRLIDFTDHSQVLHSLELFFHFREEGYGNSSWHSKCKRYCRLETSSVCRLPAQVLPMTLPSVLLLQVSPVVLDEVRSQHRCPDEFLFCSWWDVQRTDPVP